jgi:hypothetical protein
MLHVPVSGLCKIWGYQEEKFMTAFDESKQKLESLKTVRADLERELLKEINDEDPHPSRIVALRKQLDENAVYQYAERARILRLQKQEHLADRDAALSEREQLEQELREAAKEYVIASDIANEKRIAYETIQVKLFGNTSRLDNNRENIGLKQKQLGEHIGRWRQDALLVEGPCDL